MAVRERIYLTKRELEEREMAILDDRHIERYMMVRQWCSGVVLDYGCGCGYGTHMLSRNPDVTLALGYDIDDDVQTYAKNNYASDKVAFVHSVPQCDTLVALEVMEHIKDESAVVQVAMACNAHDIIVSYPSKKTTHYNKHHYHDFTRGDMHRLWEEATQNKFQVVEFIHLYHEHMIVRIKRVQ